MHAATSKKHVLLIEDEWGFRKVFGDVLKSGGFQCTEAEDGESGLKLAKLLKPDVILLDLILPKLSGHDVLKKLRADRQTRSIPVIMLTVIGDQHEVASCLKAGADEYAIKGSFQSTDITQIIDAVLQKKKDVRAATTAPYSMKKSYIRMELKQKTRL